MIAAERESSITTRRAVERAIELSKLSKKESWQNLAQREDVISRTPPATERCNKTAGAGIEPTPG